MEIERLSETNAIVDTVLLAASFNEESPFGTVFDGAIASERILTLVEIGSAEFFILRKDGKAIGMLGAVTGPDLVSAEIKAQELCWYVMPEHRGGSGAVRLFNAFEEWAKGRGATRLIMTALSGSGSSSDPEQSGSGSVAKFYERRGYAPIETNYLKTL